MTTLGSHAYSLDVHDRPGTYWPVPKCNELVQELRHFASSILNPLPDYQCLSLAPHVLDDKLLVIIRQKEYPHQIIAFTSSVYLDMPFLKEYGVCTTVLHCGLTCVSPIARGRNLTIQLTYSAWAHMVQEHPEGFWLTNVAEVISSLGNFAIYTQHCYPHPSRTEPLEVQVRIAKDISLRHRASMAISPDAVFDPITFVFEGSNFPGSCFRKDTDDRRYHHRNNTETEYFREFLGRNEGNEVLQVGFLSLNLLLQALNTYKNKSKLQVSQLLRYTYLPIPYAQQVEN